MIEESHNRDSLTIQSLHQQLQVTQRSIIEADEQRTRNALEGPIKRLQILALATKEIEAATDTSSSGFFAEDPALHRKNLYCRAGMTLEKAQAKVDELESHCVPNAKPLNLFNAIIKSRTANCNHAAFAVSVLGRQRGLDVRVMYSMGIGHHIAVLHFGGRPESFGDSWQSAYGLYADRCLVYGEEIDQIGGLRYEEYLNGLLNKL